MSAKIKPAYEDDFVCMWNPAEGIGKYGTGRFQGCVKSLSLYQYDCYGRLVYICQVSSGLTDSEKRELAMPELYPKTVHVEYDERLYESRGDPSNALINPRIGEHRFRDDKLPRECVNDDLRDP